MNEEVIRQCAEEACGPEWYGPKPNLMRGGGERAIHLYHARAVQPLVEAGKVAEREMQAILDNFTSLDDVSAALERLRTALAPFQQETTNAAD